MTCTFQSRGPYQLPHLVLQGLQDFEPARQNVHPQSTIISPGQYLIFNIPARGRNNAKVLLISLHWSITSRHHHRLCMYFCPLLFWASSPLTKGFEACVLLFFSLHCLSGICFRCRCRLRIHLVS